MNTVPTSTVPTSTVTKGHRMIDRADTEASLARVAFAAFLYHPTKHLDEPGWTVDEDIDWALTPLRDLDPTARAVWRERIREVMTSPLSQLPGVVIRRREDSGRCRLRAGLSRRMLPRCARSATPRPGTAPPPPTSCAAIGTPPHTDHTVHGLDRRAYLGLGATDLRCRLPRCRVRGCGGDRGTDRGSSCGEGLLQDGAGQ